MRPPILLLTASLIFSFALVAPAPAALGPKGRRISPPVGRQAEPLGLPGEVNDEGMLDQMDEAASKLIAAGKTVKMAELIRQLGRRSCSLTLPLFTPRPTSAAQVATSARAGVVAIGTLSKCKKCPLWHVGASSGFMLTTDGVCVTCYHVVDVPGSPTLIAMTGDGRIVAVKEVLAANPHTDIALVRLDGTNFTALPLDFEAPVGSTVRVLSHPDDHFFTLTEGLVSRYVSLPLERVPGEVTFMAVTADFGSGSSGAPVFNERGGVVGVVNNTQSLYFDTKKSKDLQMVFKHCLPSHYIRQLVTGR